MVQQFFNISQDQANSDPNNIYVNINNGSAEIWLENQPVQSSLTLI